MPLQVVQGPADSDKGSSTTSTWQPTFIFPTGFSNTQVSLQHNQAAEHKWWLGGYTLNNERSHTGIVPGEGTGGDEAETQKILNKTET